MPYYDHDIRHDNERKPLHLLLTEFTGKPHETIARHMPDRTLDQLMTKLAMSGEAIERVFMDSRGFLRVDLPSGRYFYSLSVDGTQWVLDQVL